jgi:hypothetical protein
MVYVTNRVTPGVTTLTAGAYYGIWGTAITLYGILTGFLIDAMGVRTSLVVGGDTQEVTHTHTRKATHRTN